MKVNCPNLAKPLQDRCPPPPATDKEVTPPNLKDILGEDRVLRLPTLPVKFPPDIANKLKDLFKNLPPCPPPAEPPILWDQLDPKFQNKPDDTRLA